MSDNNSGGELAKNLPEVDPADQATLLLQKLGDPAAMDAFLRDREWTASKNASGNAGWPTHPGDHRHESTPRGRGST